MSATKGMWLTTGAGREDPATGRAGAVLINVENRSSLAACLSAELEPDREGL